MKSLLTTGKYLLRRIRSNQTARLVCLLLGFAFILHVSEQINYLHANPGNKPYKIAKLTDTARVTLVEVELRQARSAPELKFLGDTIKQAKSPDKPIMVLFFRGQRNEENYFANYQDGKLYLEQVT